MSKKMPLRKRLNKALVSLFVIVVFVTPPILTIKWAADLVFHHPKTATKPVVTKPSQVSF